MITCKVFLDGRPSDERVEPSDVGDVLARDDAFVWLDSLDPTDDDLAVLQKVFDLHPLTIEDVKHRHQRPKVEIYQNYAFVVLRPIELIDGGMIEKELHAFVGRRFIVTLRPSPACDMTGIASRWERQPELFREGGGYAIYVLIDEVVDDYLTAVERFEDDVDELEDAIFADGETRDLYIGQNRKSAQPRSIAPAWLLARASPSCNLNALNRRRRDRWLGLQALRIRSTDMRRLRLLCTRRSSPQPSPGGARDRAAPCAASGRASERHI
jgi:magnesium transporter